MEIKPKAIRVVKNKLCKQNSIKINYELFGIYSLSSKDVQEIKSFNTKYVIMTQSSNFEYIFEELFRVIEKKISEIQKRDLGHFCFNFQYFSNISVRLILYI